MKHCRLNLIAFVVLAWHSIFAADVVPAARRVTWTPGTTVGVDGGIDQYLTGRTTAGGLNAITDFSADNTGASDTSTELQAMMDALATDQVGYIPIGAYKVSTGLSAGFKDRFTLRGATFNGLPFVKSTTSNAVAGSGTKTFTVPAGVGWSAGDGIYVYPRLGLNVSMRGTVSSYSGTSLVVAVSGSEGSGTFTDWMISLTVLLWDGSGAAINLGNMGSDYSVFQGNSGADQAGGFPLINWVTISGSPAKGDTSFVVSTASGLSVGQLCEVLIRDQHDPTAIEAGEPIVIGVGGTGTSGDGTMGYVRRQTNRISALVGTTVILEIPLAFDLPSSLTPRFVASNNRAEKCGAESIWVVGDDSGGGGDNCFEIGMGCNSWIYNCIGSHPSNYHIMFECAYKCEARRNWMLDRDRDYTGSSGAGFLSHQMGSSLIEDNIVVGTFPGCEINDASVGNALLYNFMEGGDGSGIAYMNMNHGPHNSFNLVEGNVVPHIQADGYHGSSSEDTWARNYFEGSVTYLAAFTVLNRFCRGYNIVGNVIGHISVYDGLMSFGNPNIGNGFEFPTGAHVSPTTNVWWVQFPEGPVVATVANSGTGALTLTSPTIYDYFVSPYTGPGADLTMNMYHAAGVRTGITSFSGSGSTLNILNGSGAIPGNGTTVYLYTAQNGYQERDDDTENTAIVLANGLVTGGSYAQQTYGGGTLPDSYARSSTPAWWPSSLAWPPVDPVSPTYSQEIIPAGYRYINGEDPPDDAVANPTFSPVAGVYGSTQSVTISTVTVGATIRYTTNGVDPTNASGTIYSTPVSIPTTTTLKAIAYDGVLSDSSVTTGVFTISAGPVATLTVSGTTTVTGTLTLP